MDRFTDKATGPTWLMAPIHILCVPLSVNIIIIKSHVGVSLKFTGGKTWYHFPNIKYWHSYVGQKSPFKNLHLSKSSLNAHMEQEELDLWFTFTILRTLKVQFILITPKMYRFGFNYVSPRFHQYSISRLRNNIKLAPPFGIWLNWPLIRKPRGYIWFLCFAVNFYRNYFCGKNREKQVRHLSKQYKQNMNIKKRKV